MGIETRDFDTVQDYAAASGRRECLREGCEQRLPVRVGREEELVLPDGQRYQEARCGGDEISMAPLVHTGKAAMHEVVDDHNGPGTTTRWTFIRSLTTAST